MNHLTRGALALAFGIATSSASAQSSVQIYGIVDSGVVHTTNADAEGDSITKVPSLTGSFPSRIGFRGTEDLGGALEAFFVLETGIAMDSGALGQGNRLFGRAAHVGLKGDWGALTVGRQVNMTYIATIKTDVMGPNLFAISSIDGYLPNARSDNAIGYMGNVGNLVVGATWSVGRDASSAGGPAATNCAGEVAGDAKACRQYTALLGWETKRWGVIGSYDKLHGNSGAAFGLTSSAHTDVRTTLNGYLMLGTTRLGAGVIHRDTTAATGQALSNLWYLGASHPMGPFTLDAQWARRDLRDSPSDVSMLVARLTYSLSKRSHVYAAVGRMDNDGASAIALDAGGTVGAGMAQNGVMVGLRHHF